MAYYKPDRIAEITVETGVKKARNSTLNVMILGFLAGAFIALGFLLDIRVIAGASPAWGGIAGFIGAAVFPVGLILVLLAGGELLTGNMMAVSLARFKQRISTKELIRNLALVTVSNLAGALFVAYFFGHVTGLTGSGVYLEKLVNMAGHKLDDSFLQAFLSGIGCNWLVALAVWLSYGSDQMSGKILGIWFPTMAFVAIGFQHVVANMFLIPAAIFEGYYSWGQYFMNFIPVWLGNFVGGSLFVAAAYGSVYLKNSNRAEEVSGIHNDAAAVTTTPAAGSPPEVHSAQQVS
ncbi:formate/nitrite transporter family protein [Paenibacillus glucanolyticus]|jgi:formate/nitrite transporter|uniref:formate/nitrite transporter family protein n=1 Tax=Paenibacillus TaxID=44249 RepID=UPI0003E2420D|nr:MULTISPECIES: formate/nitrite transporter family protein [Paenibacillus]ANA79865.1 formate/nitrite transporter [Paenibacillus glucanolyticus]AVV56111.1 formate/nitrite transporter family protein [Paenibacillus glucanolyticus]ETT38245.1 formate/nitrite transporter [Paenibacillus sp. FSL R5-808]MPY20168.1 formate/nitrite transporter family protein [Paenibacillus glucanolyticus]OMF81700.1 formate/nitrite transporter [Paenibacillus glucanolyticus]